MLSYEISKYFIIVEVRFGLVECDAENEPFSSISLKEHNRTKAL
jgi:hypothetical protein